MDAAQEPEDTSEQLQNSLIQIKPITTHKEPGSLAMPAMHVYYFRPTVKSTDKEHASHLGVFQPSLQLSLIP